MRLVMDHSALIPCGDKPDYEKEAIRLLGNALPRLNAILYASYRYLKTLASVCAREWRRHHPLPKLQASLDRILRELLELASAKRWQCRDNILSVRSGLAFPQRELWPAIRACSFVSPKRYMGHVSNLIHGGWR